jgi:hypothetical protein
MMGIITDLEVVLKNLGYRPNTTAQELMKDEYDVLIRIVDSPMEVESVASYRVRFNIDITFLCFDSINYYNLVKSIIENVYTNLNDVKFKWIDIKPEIENQTYLVHFIAEYQEVINVG